MAVNKKINETGWFYHAPAKKKTNCVKKDAPAPSQIPGIGFDDPTLLEKEEVRTMTFKETDSKYIQLAKVGGRKDLLCFNPELYKKKTQGGPVGYPRNEWFYLEDNRVEDEEKKKEESWDFLLPEYMVHKSYQPSFENPSTPPVRGNGAPFYTERDSVLEREGRSATDKTIKIPEVRRPGFGVRNEKPAPTIKSIPREKAIRPQDSEKTQKDKRRGNQMKMPTEDEEPTMMSKLLGGGYERDWYDKLAETDSKADELKAQSKQTPVASAACIRDNSTPPQSRKTNMEEKALFKLTKFKNVPSRINTHQSAHVLAATK